jgi:hypothetical protein
MAGLVPAIHAVHPPAGLKKAAGDLMPEYSPNSWKEFEEVVEEIKIYNKDSLVPLLFRGHQDANWPLQSTLERRHYNKCLAGRYYGLILRLKSEIELFAELHWELDPIQKMFDLIGDYDKFSLVLSSPSRTFPGDSYLAYLRHHGFPSPLLDRSRSPNIAAYFAFRDAGPQQRAIYVLAEKPHNRKGASSNEAQIFCLRNVRKPHKRHYFQQSEYTVCVQFDPEDGWSFVPYQEIESRHICSLDDWKLVHQTHWSANEQDVIFKIRLPADMRPDVLSRLDSFNLNGFSLFGTEDSFMETLTLREIDLRGEIR